MRFEWDDDKAARNFTKHGIRFSETKSVFEDDLNSITFSDPEHSFDEARYIAIGISHRGQLLTIVYVEREGYIRIISARKANLREVRLYDEG
jgi:uncharacterized protein